MPLSPDTAKLTIAALEDSRRAYERASNRSWASDLGTQLGFSDEELAGQMSLTDEAREEEGT